MPWSSSVLNQHPMYDIFKNIMPKLSSMPTWPSLSNYNVISSSKHITTKSGKEIVFVAQEDVSTDFEKQYEPRIYLTGEIQTRHQNWHDFFNFLIWMTFPATKTQINAEQYFLLKKRRGVTKQRSIYENVLTLFDENGIIVVSSSYYLLDLIKEFKWKELFLHQRDQLEKQLKVFVFGHSLHEKALHPYIGMTGHAILISETAEFFDFNLSHQIATIDLKIARIFAQKLLTSAQDFYPIPILGMPGWHIENKNPSFYNNMQYFRPKRLKL